MRALLLIILCAVVSCSALSAQKGSMVLADRPVWVDRPKSDDSIYLYRVGFSRDQPSEVEARKAALTAVGDSLCEEFLMRAGIDPGDRGLYQGVLRLDGLEPLPDAVYYESGPGGFSCWIQVSFPLSAKAAILKQLESSRTAMEQERRARKELTKQAAEQFADARSALVAGDADAALRQLSLVASNYHRLLNPAYELEAVQMMMGDAYRGRNENQSARALYDAIASTTTSSSWKTEAAARVQALPKPPRFWPMRMRWGDRKIGLLCVRQEGSGPATVFLALNHIFARDLRECEMAGMELTGAAPEDVSSLFDRQVVTPIADTAQAAGAGIVLAVRLRTDPALRGQTQDVMGVKIPVPDSQVDLLVLDVSGGRVQFSAQFKEMSGSVGDEKIAERIGGIAVAKYLLPSAPAFPAQEDEDASLTNMLSTEGN